jgi:UDP-N-acetylglucosamine:LPS N-acetylglucosamine transferase
MKIALVCSFGGHLTELKFLSAAFGGHETFFVTYENIRTRDLTGKAYLLDSIDTSPVRMLEAFYRIGRIFLEERPDVVVSTGSEIAIPAFVWARLTGAETIYIESWCRVEEVSMTGKLVYPISDLFLVQWPDLAEESGDKARYEGTVI